MPLAEITPGSDVLDLGTYDFDPGQYTFYMEAVGQPSNLNHVSPPVQVTFLAPVPVTLPTPVTLPVPVTSPAPLNYPAPSSDQQA